MPVGTGANQKNTAVALYNICQISATDNSKLNIVEDYSLSLTRVSKVGVHSRTTSKFITRADNNGRAFEKAADYVGKKTFPDYQSYAGAHIFNITFPGCTVPGSRVFVGQRHEPFFIALGETFDLINYNSPVAANGSEANDIGHKNITTIALELPIA